ncbi:MAG: YceH family protein [Microthrixaceae bacterium]
MYPDPHEASPAEAGPAEAGPAEASPAGTVDQSGDVMLLTAAQARVLGCLIEKQLATPDTYPMTLKALTNACNQSTSRFPVVDYAETLVETTLQALKAKKLIRIVHPAHGERATKYRHVIDEAFGLTTPQRAIIGLLLLRGPQTVSELRTRSERLHGFDSPEELESTLGSLQTMSPPLVQRLARQPGQKGERWIQLLEANASERVDAYIASTGASGGGDGETRSGSARDEIAALKDRVSNLEDRVDSLMRELGYAETGS